MDERREKRKLEKEMRRPYFHESRGLIMHKNVSAQIIPVPANIDMTNRDMWARYLYPTQHPPLVSIVKGVDDEGREVMLNMPLPTPRGYGWGEATFVDSARNVKGYVVGAVIRENVERLELTWNYLLDEDVGVLRNIPFKSYVSYVSPGYGRVVRLMYKSDLTLQTPLVKSDYGSLDATGKPPGYSDVRIALIEI